MSTARPVERLFELLEGGGGAQYLGEPVTQLEHALQAAALAEAAGADEALVIAALLHDIGHLLPGEPHERNGAERSFLPLVESEIGQEFKSVGRRLFDQRPERLAPQRFVMRSEKLLKSIDRHVRVIGRNDL